MPPWTAPAVIARIVLTALAVFASVGLMYLLRETLSWIFLAMFLAIAVSGPVAWFGKFMPRGAAIAATYLLMFLVPLGLALAILPSVVDGVDGLVRQAPQLAADAQDYVQNSSFLARLENDYQVFSGLRERLADLPSVLGNVAGWLSDLGLGAVNSGFAMVNVVLLSIFMVAGGPRWSAAFLRTRDEEHAERLRRVFSGIGATVGNYVMGALGQALIAGITTWIVLMILDVPFAAGLAAITFLLDLIPLVGATIAGVLVGIFTIFAGFPATTIIWAIWALVYQQIENNLIQPQIQRRAVAIEPIVVLISVLVGASLAGVLGAIIAIPIAASLQLVVREWRSYAAEMRGERVLMLDGDEDSFVGPADVDEPEAADSPDESPTQPGESPAAG